MEGFSKRSQNLDEPSASGTLGQSHLVFSHEEGRKRFQPRLASPNFSLQRFQGSQDNVGECRMNPDKDLGLIRKRAPKLRRQRGQSCGCQNKQTQKTPGVLMKQSQCFEKSRRAVVSWFIPKSLVSPTNVSQRRLLPLLMKAN